jgi:hypothetical protein
MQGLHPSYGEKANMNCIFLVSTTKQEMKPKSSFAVYDRTKYALQQSPAALRLNMMMASHWESHIGPDKLYIRSCCI